MTQIKHGGFTMIETMLVLAIGGLLTAGLMAGAGMTITKQRYRESVQGVQAFVQDGYNLTVVSQNSRQDKRACEDDNVAKSPTGSLVGQSDCMLVGRYITIDSDGLMKSQSVVAYQKVANPDVDDSLSEVYSLLVADIDNQERSIPWSSWITEPTKPDTPSSASILIMRSPLNNAITTYSVDRIVPASQVGSVLPVPSNENKNFDMCITTDAAFAGQTQAVRIKPRSAATNGVVIPDESEGVCDD